MIRRSHWVAPFLLLAACSGPGMPPAGQPPLATLARLDPVIQRFNEAKPGQVQVVAMFSPT